MNSDQADSKTDYCNRPARPGHDRVSRPAALLVLLAVSLLPGCGPGEPLQPGDGREAYLRYCASCHGNAGEGRPPTFPPMAGSEWMRLPAEALALIVIGGLQGEIEVAGQRYRGYMPPMQHLSDADVASVVGYMEETWGRGRSSGLSENEVGRLRSQYGSRRQPWHGLEGLEEALGPLAMER